MLAAGQLVEITRESSELNHQSFHHLALLRRQGCDAVTAVRQPAFDEETARAPVRALGSGEDLLLLHFRATDGKSGRISASLAAFDVGRVGNGHATLTSLVVIAAASGIRPNALRIRTLCSSTR